MSKLVMIFVLSLVFAAAALAGPAMAGKQKPKSSTPVVAVTSDNGDNPAVQPPKAGGGGRFRT
jgi:hypothetical protein